MGKKYLRFEDVSDPTKKTKKFDVMNDKGDYLGMISWKYSWRQYTFYPPDSTFWSRGCLKEVVDFIEKLIQERKNK